MSSSDHHVPTPSSEFMTPSSRWAALQTRNPAAANSFIYSVITTKIYCRPTCPSRLARRANIIFHDTAADAEKDGFRPCRRCRPELAASEVPQRKAIEMACKLINDEVRQSGKPGAKKWSIKALATEMGLTESHFCRSFKKFKGCTIGEYRAGLRSTTNSEAATTMGTPDLSESVAEEGSEPAIDVSDVNNVTWSWEMPLEGTADLTGLDHGTFIWNNQDEWNQDLNMSDWIATDEDLQNINSLPDSYGVANTSTLDSDPVLSEFAFQITDNELLQGNKI